MIEGLLQDARYGVRTLSKNLGFTAVVVLTLALGTGANTAMFSVINAVLLQPLPYDAPERLVSVREASPQHDVDRAEVSPPNFVDWHAQSSSFEQMAAFRPWGFVLTGREGPERVRGARVSAGLFSLLGIQPSLGRAFLAEEDRYGGGHVVLLSHGLWQRRFGADPAVVGRALTLNGEPYSIIGVLPPQVRLPDAELWVPLALEPYAMTQRGARSLTVLARLKEGVSPQQAQLEADALARRLALDHPDANAGWGISVVPLLDQMVRRIRPALLVLCAAVGVVLLIACANIASLLLARASSREHELALRTALGATRARLVRQLLTESVLLAFIGGAAGLLVALWGTHLLVLLIPNIPRAGEIGVDSHVLVFALLISLLIGLGLGLAPGLQASQLDLNASLKVGRSSLVRRAGRSRIRNLAVMLEVALALVLLVGSGLLLRSFVRLQAVELGFHPDHVLTMSVSLPERQYPEGGRKVAFYQQLLRRINELPGVRSVGLGSHLPLAGQALTSDFTPEDGRAVSPGAISSAEYASVDPDYFRAMGIPLLKGRSFSNRDVAGTPPVVIVNQVMARRVWPNEEPTGHHLHLGATTGADQGEREIVGVVGDVRSAGVETEPRPTIYVPYFQNPWPTMSVVVRTASAPAGLATSVRSAVLALDPNQPVYNVGTFEQVVAASVAPRRSPMLLVGVFALVALALAAVGVYGLMSYTVTLRSPEIGLRAALGAQPRDVLKLVVGRGIGLVAVGLAIGCAVALGVTRLLTTMLYGVTPTDPLTFVGASLFLVMIAALASYLPVRRALRVDPIVALRSE